MRSFVALGALLALGVAASSFFDDSCPALAACDCDWASPETCKADDNTDCWCACCCRHGGPGRGECASRLKETGCSVPSINVHGEAHDDDSSNSEEQSSMYNRTGFAMEHGRLRVESGGLVDEAGNRVQLQGVSTDALHTRTSCLSDEGLKHVVVEWGVNLVRLAVFVGDPNGGFDLEPAETMELLDDLVNSATKLGVYAMIDFHVLAPGDPREWLFEDGNRKNPGAALEFWVNVAHKYKDHSNVLYELGSQGYGVSWRALKEYHDEIIFAIRMHDPLAVIVCGTPEWSTHILDVLEEEVYQLRNVLFSFQFYAGSHDLELLKEALKRNIPFMVTEWAPTYSSQSGGPFYSESHEFLEALNGIYEDEPIDQQQHNKFVSWVAWSWSDSPRTSSLLVDGACVGNAWAATTCSGELVKTYARANSRRYLTSGAAHYCYMGALALAALAAAVI